MTTPARPELPEPELGYIETDKSRQPAFSARQMREALQSAQPAAPGVTGAVQTLIETLKADPAYAWAWHCNVAMAAVDEGLSHYAANKAAARFLSWLAQILDQQTPENLNRCQHCGHAAHQPTKEPR